MLTILRMLASKAGWLLLSFFLIVTVLAVWNELPSKWRIWQKDAANAQFIAKSLTDSGPVFNDRARKALQDAKDEVDKIENASSAKLGEAKNDIARRREAAQAKILTGNEIAWAAWTGKADKITESYQAEYVDLPLLDRADRFIALRLGNLNLVDTSRRLREEYNRKVTVFNAEFHTREDLKQRAGQFRYWGCTRFKFRPGCQLVRDVRNLDKDLELKHKELRRDAAILDGSQRATREAAHLGEKVADGEEIIARASINYSAQAQDWSKNANTYARNQASAAVSRYGWQAFRIVFLAALLPILHKLFAFFIIAPAAARAQPVLLRSTRAKIIASESGISVDVPLALNSELLLRSGLQSSASDIRGGDKLVLDWSIVFTCMAAGLVNLQRLRSDRPDHVVVTGSDIEHRVIAIEVPAGGAVVLQPRALLGVVKLRGQRLVITRPWRINWLISWITAQFRYIVFNGPCTLIVQGCNGVRVEDAAHGRMINKRLTLGFDAGLAYGAARSTSFLAYLRGQASLFNDRFTGEGFYLYEQRAAGSGKGSIWGRGLKGIGDAMLNVLGI